MVHSCLAPKQTAAAATQLYVAQLGTGGGFFTELTLVNPGTGTVTVEINARDNDGNLLAAAATPSLTRNLAPGAHLTLSARAAFGLPSQLISGYIEINVKSGGGVLGSVTFGSEDGRALASLPIQATGKKTITLSQVAQTESLFTGVTILNPSNSSITVKLTVHDETGEIVGSADIPLKPKEKTAKLIHEWVPAAARQVGGYIRIIAPENVFCFELFGSPDLNFLAAVPAQ